MSSNSRPLVTVVMPAHNADATLATSLASIVGQSYERWELLVADDGSTDGTADVIDAFARRDSRVRKVAGRRQAGRAARLNQLVSLARGALIARMDADDVSYPDRLERQVELMSARPEVDLVGSSMIVFGSDGTAFAKRLAPPGHRGICAHPARGFILFHPTWIGRAAWFRANRYSADADRCEDQELLLRTHTRSVFANIEAPLLGYRELGVKLIPTLVGRWNYVRCAAGLFRSRTDIGGLFALIWHPARGALDAVAVGLNLDRLLRERAAVPLSFDERRRWDLVYRTTVDSAGLPAVVQQGTRT